MLKLSKLRRSVGSRTSKVKSSSKTAMTLSLLVAAGVTAAPLQAQAAGKLHVETKEGPVKGFLVNGVAVFLGIPYAEPPVGNLRWKPSKKHAPWTNVLKATAYGPTCAQITTLGVFAGPANNNEDCLYLNVFTPNVDPAAKESLPVIFWIHGGGNVDGESNDYDASKLAAQGHAVVVTINYRLNLMGWLAHPALDAEGHLFGNYGTLDQQLALKWVRRNIAQFGGDKNNVTVGGQSAGSGNTVANLVSPLASGLFNRAILESGIPEPTPLSSAEAQGTAFSVAAGCGSGATPAVAKCLRNLTAAQIEALAGTASAQSSYTNDFIADGQILPTSFIGAFKKGQFSHMPIMDGTVHDENNFFIAITEYYSDPPRVPTTDADFNNFITNTFSSPPYPAGTADRVRAHYPLSAYPTAQLALDAVGTDSSAFFPCGHLNFNKIVANQVPVYAYEFNDLTAPSYFPKMPGYVPLAYHTSDIQFLFPLYHGGPLGIPHELNNKQKQLSDQLVTAWTNFAWTGNPNGQGNSPWPRFRNGSGESGYYLSENIPVLSTMTAEQISAEHKCDFWNTILTY